MIHSNDLVVSAALTRARQELVKQQPTPQEVLGSTLVHTEVPTDAEVPVAKPKRTRKKVVD